MGATVFLYPWQWAEAADMVSAATAVHSTDDCCHRAALLAASRQVGHSHTCVLSGGLPYRPSRAGAGAHRAGAP